MTQAEPKPKKRIRKQRLDLQLEQALRDAAAACENNVDPSTRILINSRLTILSHRLNKAENGKLSKALAEIERLRAQHEQDIVEITRLQSLVMKPTEIDLALQQYAESKKGKHESTI